MREIVLDTETTGFDPTDGHRVVELACVELINLCRPGASCTCYSTRSATCRPKPLLVHGLTANS